MAALFLISILLAQAPAGSLVGPTDFPTSASEYERGVVVAVSNTTLELLQDERLRALLQFVGSCGRIMLVDVSPSIEAIIRNDAACDGRYVLAVAATDDLGARSLELANLPDPARASDAELLALLGKLDSGKLNLSHLVWFWLSYLLIAVALLLNSRTRIAGLGFSVAATLLVPITWPPAISRTLVAWAEVEADDRVAAFFSVEQEASFHRGQFASNVTRRRGSFDRNPSLAFSIRDNDVEICNHGSANSVGGHVFWHGSMFAIPEIQPGTSWSSGDGRALEPSAMSTPELTLYLKRSEQHDLTFLRALPVSDIDGHGWLLQYADPDQDLPSCER